MLTMIVGPEDMRSGPIPVALAHAGFEGRSTLTTDQADCDVDTHGAEDCLLVVDAGALASRAGSGTWASFLTAHPRVPAVVVARGGADPEAREAARGPHRVLVEDPFDAAAVVAAARRASAARRRPRRSSSSAHARETG